MILSGLCSCWIKKCACEHKHTGAPQLNEFYPLHILTRLASSRTEPEKVGLWRQEGLNTEPEEVRLEEV